MTDAEKAALQWLAERPGGGTLATFIPDEHGKALAALARQTGRDKPISVRTGRGGFRTLTIRDAGRAALAK